MAEEHLCSYIYFSPRQLNQEGSLEGREELRNSINREPIYEWEGSQRDSLGTITYVTKVRLQHLPCQVLTSNESQGKQHENSREDGAAPGGCSHTLETLHKCVLNPGDSSRFDIVQRAP